jgi:hypothetical protein
MKPALLLVALAAIGLAVIVGLQYGWPGVGLVVLCLTGLAAIPWFIGAQGAGRAERGWSMLTQAHDAVGHGAPVPAPEQWEPWLVEMAAGRAQYEDAIYARAAQLDHDFREPFQRLICGFATGRALELAHHHLQAHPGDLVAPQLAAYLIARGTPGEHAAAVAAALTACPPEELGDAAEALLFRMESADDAGGWRDTAVAHRERLQAGLDPDHMARWDAAIAAV